MTDLATLFSKDPEECTRDDILSIIKEFRLRRTQFNLGAIETNRTKTKKTVKTPTADIDLSGINL